jgi:teichuronic acid biosynthesis glycosyltransferase TuaC
MTALNHSSLERSLRILMLTSEWPTPERPEAVPFIVRSVEFLRRAGQDVDVFHFRGARRPSNYLHAWRELRRRLQDKQYDVLHAQWGQSGLPALPSPLPLVVTFRGSDLEGIVGSDGRYTRAGLILRLASQLPAHVADEVVVVSERLARYLPRRPYHVIPSGIDLNLFKPLPIRAAREQLGLPEQSRLILFAADPKNTVKRYALAQAAVDQIRAEQPIELVVTKGVSPSEMPLYMNACDALLLTSLHEGSPNVVKEALACNLPIVSTDVGDVRMRIQGIEGCAIARDTPQHLAEALRMILSRNDRVDGRPTVVALDEQALTEKLIAVYYQALSKRSRPHLIV